MKHSPLKQLEKTQKRINEMQGRYMRYLEGEERTKKLNQDVHLSKQDEGTLIESFVIAGVVEKFIESLLLKFIKF